MKVKIYIFILLSDIIVLSTAASKIHNLNACFDNLLGDNSHENRYKSLLQTGIDDFSVGLFVGSGGRISKMSTIQRIGNVIVHPGNVETWIEMSFVVQHVDVVWDNSTCFGIRCQLWATILDNKFVLKMAVRPINCQVSYNINLNNVGLMEVYVSKSPKYVPNFFFNGALYIVEVFFKENIKHHINYSFLHDFIDRNQIDQICKTVNRTIYTQTD